MQDIPEVIAPDGRPFWKPIKVLIHLLMRVSAGLSRMMANIMPLAQERCARVPVRQEKR